MWGKPISEIAQADLEALVTDRVAEGKTIDFKLTPPKRSDAAAKEFLADVSSFANAAGGHIVLGMKERAGIASELVGIDLIDSDAEVLRLDNLMRDGIEPRVPGIDVHCVSLDSGMKSIVIRIPRSWTPPHAVTYRKHFRFYSRNSAGKYPLDVGELRQLFALGESVADWIRSFRAARLAAIVADETPLPLEGDAKVVIHLVPVSASTAGSRLYDVIGLTDNPGQVRPIYTSGWDDRLNLDGFLSFSQYPQAPGVHTYVQVFRNGAIEAAATDLLGRPGREDAIASLTFEEELIKALPRLSSVQRELGVETPIVLMLSLIGVRGLRMGVDARWHGPDHDRIDRDQIVLPEVLLDSFDFEAHEVLHPLFDAVWNAAGWPRSIYYDEAGNRRRG